MKQKYSALHVARQAGLLGDLSHLGVFVGPREIVPGNRQGNLWSGQTQWATQGLALAENHGGLGLGDINKLTTKFCRGGESKGE